MGGSIEVSEVRQHVRDWGRKYAGRRLAILGAGAVGAAVLRCLRDCGGRVVGVMDDYMVPDSRLEDLPILPSKALPTLQADAVILGTNKTRQRMRYRLQQLAYVGEVLCLPGEDAEVFVPGDGKGVAEIGRFHNLHAGERAFIIGNGPSLNVTDPRRIRNAVTIGCNGIFLLEGFTPTYYCLANPACAEDRREQIDPLPWVKFLASDLRRWLTNGHFFNAIRTPEISTFSTDFASGAQVGASVTPTMIQLAFYMGCDPVYLVGVDHSYDLGAFRKDPGKVELACTGNDTSHFHSAYSSKGGRAYHPRLDQMEAEYRLSLEALARHGRRIYNATAGGRLEIFERIDFERLMR